MREVLGFIAQDNPDAASSLAEQMLNGLDQKSRFPQSGRVIPEAPEHPARELVMPPCRIFYLADQVSLHVLSIMRSERLFRIKNLEN